MSISRIFPAAVLAAASLPVAAFSQSAPSLGTPVGEADIAAYTLTVLPSGLGMPLGSGSVAQGQKVYSGKCVGCHGERGSGGSGGQLSGGVGSLASAMPVKTVSSFWPSATSVFDYVRRAMPINAPKSLTDDEVYAVTAYLLSLDGIVANDAVMDASTVPKVVMPNAHGFVSWWPDPTLTRPRASSAQGTRSAPTRAPKSRG
jgi:hypothetical protein